MPGEASETPTEEDAEQAEPSGAMLLNVAMRATQSRAYLLDDAHNDDAMALCLSLALELHLIQAPDDLELVAKIKHWRGYNTSGHLSTLPVSPADFLQPVDVEVELEQGSIEKGKVTISNVHIRTGFANVDLVQRAMASLSPPTADRTTSTGGMETKHSEGESEQKHEGDAAPEPAAPEPDDKQQQQAVAAADAPAVMQNYDLQLPLLLVDVVNDRGSMDLPLLQLRMHQILAKYISLPNQQDSYTDDSVDCLRANVLLSVAIDSYNKTLTVWEPVVEPWAITLEAKRGPNPQSRLQFQSSAANQRAEARRKQKWSARRWHRLRKQDPKSAYIQNAMKVNVSTQDVLNLNLTIPFINLCLEAQTMFQSSGASHDSQNKYFIVVENQLGVDITVVDASGDGAGSYAGWWSPGFALLGRLYERVRL